MQLRTASSEFLGAGVGTGSGVRFPGDGVGVGSETFLIGSGGAAVEVLVMTGDCMLDVLALCESEGARAMGV